MWCVLVWNSVDTRSENFFWGGGCCFKEGESVKLQNKKSAFSHHVFQMGGINSTDNFKTDCWEKCTDHAILLPNVNTSLKLIGWWGFLWSYHSLGFFLTWVALSLPKLAVGSGLWGSWQRLQWGTWNPSA